MEPTLAEEGEVLFQFYFRKKCKWFGLVGPLGNPIQTKAHCPLCALPEFLGHLSSDCSNSRKEPPLNRPFHEKCLNRCLLLASSVHLQKASRDLHKVNPVYHRGR